MSKHWENAEFWFFHLLQRSRMWGGNKFTLTHFLVSSPDSHPIPRKGHNHRTQLCPPHPANAQVYWSEWKTQNTTLGKAPFSTKKYFVSAGVYGCVGTDKIMLSRSVNPFKLYLCRLSPLKRLISDCAHTYADQVPFSSWISERGEWRRSDFMINIHGRYVSELGFGFVTPGSAVRHATDFWQSFMKMTLFSCLVIWMSCLVLRPNVVSRWRAALIY